MKKILAIGTPRGGTGYTSSFMEDIGRKIGHEKMSTYGVSDWTMLLPKLGVDVEIPHNKPHRNEKFEFLVHIIREPFSCVCTMVNIYGSSFVFDDNGIEKVKHRNVVYFSKKINPNLFDGCKNKFDACARAYLFWHEKIESLNPDFTFRIEKDHDKYVDFLVQQNILDKKVEIKQKHKTPVTLKDTHPKKTRKITPEDVLSNLTKEAKESLEAFKKKYNYE
jgi:hypothetical protein